MTFLTIFGTIIAAAILGGGSAGLLGVFVVGLRMPFITVFAAHAALAGAVFGVLVGMDPGLSGFLGALSGAIVLGILLKNKKEDPNAAMGTLFSLMLGIAFLGIGLNKGPKSPILSLLWGSLLFVTSRQLLLMAILAGLLICFVVFFYNELKALMFSRELAALVIPEWLILNLLLILSAGIITINLEIVGGLMLYSLISNPAVAAARLAHSFRQALILSSFFGALSALGGFLTAYWLNLPVGACIVLFSSMIVGISIIISK
ncbi:metal ABC transporter permease [Candidatus Latescibacterota bacterium]